jgi:hypothetical protein
MRAAKTRRSGKLSFALRSIVVAAAVMVAVPGAAFADPPPALDWNAPSTDRSYEPAFDYDSDGCYPTPAIGSNGVIAPGLNTSGAINGSCHDAWDLDNVNVYSRSKCNNGWCAYMYGVYFEKDQAVHGSGLGGHRHDWEHVVVWVPDGGWPTYVSASAHGNYNIRSRNDIPWDSSGTHPKIIYHKDGAGTHAFRFAGFGEEPENHEKAWQYPPLIGWDGYPPGFRDRLMSANFGSAQLDIRDSSFNGALAKAKPGNIPFNPNG